MITYNNDTVQYNETMTNFKTLGSVQTITLDGAIPFYALFQGTDKYFNVYDEKVCGGSCFDYLSQYLSIYYI